LPDNQETRQEWVHMGNAHPMRPSGGNEEVNLEIDDTQGVRHLGDAHQPPILVLSRDAGLIETVRKAAPRGTPVRPAPDLDRVADELPDLKPGVLVVDTASTSDVAGMVAQLTQHFPELVVVVAGKREDSASLMQLTAAGRIFRFLLTPLSHGQTRLALEAAVTQHVDLKNAGQRLSTAAAPAGDGGSKNYVVTYGALAAGLVLIIGGIWFGISHFSGGADAPPAPVAAVADQPAGIPEKPDPVQAELNLAKQAFDQGRYLEPAGESALDLYRSALALDPNSEAAKAGIRSVADKMLERAEAALTAERLEEAIQNIEIARDIDASHPRLSFLDTQIARERERIKLSQARDVGNRVKALIAQASDRMQNGRLITPPGASARDSLIEARRLDPTDPAVAQGIRELSNILAEQAREALAAGKVDEAQTLVNGARQLGSAGAQLAAVERAIADANRQASAARRPAASTPAPAAGPNVDGMVADVRQRITEGKLIDPPGDSAKDKLAALRAAAPDHPAVEELSRALSTRLLDSGKQAMAAKAFDRSAQLIAASREIGARFNEAALSQAERDLAAARQQHALQTNIVSAGSLKRVRTVEPVYPESAQKRGIEGWVELAFTVMPNGTVEDVEVRNASPADVFDEAAVRAVRQWRFEPVVQNGQRVQQRAMVRLRFSNSRN
jgi:TonB family protein